MPISAIPTRYRGCHFRSRLEARWAVFFDEAQIEWQYEPEGFDVNGAAYLPDFFLPKLDCYFEVKGTSNYSTTILKKFAQLIGKPLVIAEGDIPPSDLYDCGEKIGLQILNGSHKDAKAWGYKDMFLQCSDCGNIEIMNEVYSTMKNLCHACGAENARFMPLTHALDAARSARFEHGAKGKT